jgi:hypothetical protein
MTRLSDLPVELLELICSHLIQIDDWLPWPIETFICVSYAGLFDQKQRNFLEK